ncbi:hypothetical protein PEBR_00494 [Penicillium brasilianum]|uniref:Uncharacterized protein n=1 Tax=Penicillium brasilianum TaxID=104259 RepID=A0A1S9S0Z2_PENBI|nr:hypothetical protein PEBR_00494 [Penicillium brasilianum]
MKRPGFRHLHLSFLVGNNGVYDYEGFASGCFSESISLAKDLTHIHLTVALEDGDSAVSLKNILPVQQWPNLYHFGLSNFSVKMSDLMDLLISASSSLRFVELGSLGFPNDEGGWSELLEWMQNELDWHDRSLRPVVSITMEIDQMQPGRFALLTHEVTNFLYDSGEIPTLRSLQNFPKLGMGTLHDNFEPEYTRPHVGMQKLQELGICKPCLSCLGRAGVGSFVHHSTVLWSKGVKFGGTNLRRRESSSSGPLGYSSHQAVVDGDAVGEALWERLVGANGDFTDKTVEIVKNSGREKFIISKRFNIPLIARLIVRALNFRKLEDLLDFCQFEATNWLCGNRPLGFELNMLKCLRDFIDFGFCHIAFLLKPLEDGSLQVTRRPPDSVKKKEGQVLTERLVPWGYETPFWQMVQHGEVEVKLSGRPDYALWYGQERDLDTNMVIVEAKTAKNLGHGEAQLLAYMGRSTTSYHTERIANYFPRLFHTGRKEREHASTTVYEVVTDRVKFSFYRIYERSKWTSLHLEWDKEGSEHWKILRILLRFMSETSVRSPLSRQKSRLARRQFSSSAGDDEVMEESYCCHSF